MVIAAVVVYYAVIFEGQLPDHPALRGKNDLALHVAAFFALGVPLFLLGSWKSKLIGLVALAATIELIQCFEPQRTADWRDFAASVAGIALGGLVVLLLNIIKSFIMRSETQSNE
jgi:VanZ family protein